tara:strand:+ start:18385 stop:18756 length:372 start_codon:yes stop_codon:yes gene_type:complete
LPLLSTESVDVATTFEAESDSPSPLALLLIDTSPLSDAFTVEDEEADEAVEVDDSSVVDVLLGLRASLALLKSFAKASPLVEGVFTKGDFLGDIPEDKGNTVFESVRIISSNDREDYAIARPI